MGGNKYETEAVNLPAINMPEIRKVLAHIEGDLRRLEMRKWGITKGYVAKVIPLVTARVAGVPPEEVSEVDVEYLKVLKRLDEAGWAQCGTRACFAGWQVLLSIPRDEWFKVMTDEREMMTEVREQAAEAFGFTHDEGYAVFMPSNQKETPEEQLALLKKTINEVLEERGMTERV
jgi:hypothetical protein